MLTCKRKEELAWLYLLYTETLGIHHKQMSRTLKDLRLKVNVKDLIENHSLKAGQVRSFYLDLIRMLRRIARGSHQQSGLTLRRNDRNKIAYIFAVERTKEKFWWLGDLDEKKIREFSCTHNISRREAKEFLEEIQKDARKSCGLDLPSIK